MNGNQSWACALGDCSHYLPENVKNTITGKLSICWFCNSEFNLDERALAMDMPVCITCASGITDEVIEDKIPIIRMPKLCLDCTKPCMNDYCDICMEFYSEGKK